MRSFIIACSILGTVIIAVIFNSLYITGSASDLMNLCDSLNSESPADSAEELLTEWRSCKNIFSLTVHGSEIRRIDEALLSLRIYGTDTPEFRYHLEVARKLLRQIYEYSKPNFFTVF